MFLESGDSSSGTFLTGDREFQTAGAVMLNAFDWKLNLVAGLTGGSQEYELVKDNAASRRIDKPIVLFSETDRQTDDILPHKSQNPLQQFPRSKSATSP